MTEQRSSSATPALLTEEERHPMVMFRKLGPRQQRIAANALQHLASREPGIRHVLAVDR